MCLEARHLMIQAFVTSIKVFVKKGPPMKMQRSVSLLLFAIVFQLLFSCAAKENQGDQKDEKSEILALLNRGDNQAAIERIDRALAANPNDVELKYFKAQAYSSMTGIDVYNLFSVLKIKLFEVAMTEWQSYQRYKYLSENSTLNGIDPYDKNDALAALDIMGQKLSKMNLNEVKYELRVEPNTSLEGRCYIYANATSDILVKLDEGHVFQDDDMLIQNWTYLPMGKSCSQEQLADKRYEYELMNRLYHDALDRVARRKRDIIAQKKLAAYVQGVYVLFDAVPILKELHSYNYDNLPLTSKALDILESIRQDQNKNTHFGKNSRKQILLISFYLLASALKDSIDISNVTRPGDVICRIKPDEVVKHYDLAIIASRHIFNVIRDTDYFSEHQAELDKENAFQLAHEFLLTLPEQIDDKIKDQIFSFIRILKHARC